jgi:hypothetical protein
MEPGKLNIDDLTKMTITLGHGTEGWILDITALGHGGTTVLDKQPTAEEVKAMIGDRLYAYLDRMTTIASDTATPRT